MNKNIFFKKSFALLTVAFLLLVPNACRRELLEPLPENQFAEAVVFDTPDRFVSMLNGVYDAVKSQWFYGSRFIVYGDIRAEEFLNVTTNGVTGLQTWNHTLVESTNEVNGVWGNIYTAINAANIFIDGADRNRAVVGDDALVNQYIGEARFLRALCYHSLLTLYARPYADGNGSQPGVPLRLRPETTPGNNDLARSSVGEVYTQILADLDFAEANMALTHPSALLNTIRAHRNTAIAFKTRVLLHMQRYADVITEANKIVTQSAPFKAETGVAHELQAEIKNVFASPYTTTESIFSMPFTTNDLPGTQNGLGSYYNPGPRGIGDFSLNPAGIMGDSTAFEVDDARRAWVFLNTSNSRYYLNKFPAGPQHTDYAPVIRYAEVLLNLAEAIARTEGVSQRAVDLLNAVRTRSNADGGYDLADFATADDLIEAILTERRIEFIGEGLRSQTLMRLLLPLPGKATVSAVDANNSDYIWPIPQTELSTNKAMTPNP
jgi:hypothetical protein